MNAIPQLEVGHDKKLATAMQLLSELSYGRAQLCGMLHGVAVGSGIDNAFLTALVSYQKWSSKSAEYL